MRINYKKSLIFQIWMSKFKNSFLIAISFLINCYKVIIYLEDFYFSEMYINLHRLR